VFPTGRNWARGKHAVAAETIWTVSLFPTHPNNQPSGIAKGTKALLRPWQLPFPPARGAGTLLRPRRLPFPPTKGAGTLLCPWQRLFPPAKGAEPLLRPWQTAFLPARGTKTLSYPRQLRSFSVDSPAVDQVHFDALYQVHHPCPKTFSEPHSVYQVHPMKSDLVHLTTKTITTRGAETLLRPGRLPFPPPGAPRLFSAPGKLLFFLPGALEPFSAPGNHFSSCQGHCDPFLPLATCFSSYQGRWGPSLPLAITFSSC